MTHRLFLSFALGAALLVGSVAMAQQNGTPAKRVKLTPEQRLEWKANHVAASLGLDDKAKAKFLPVYKDFCKELAEVRKNRDEKPNVRKGKIASPALSDAEAKQWVENWLERKSNRVERSEKCLDVQKKYVKKFQGMLTPQQVVMVLRGHDGAFAGRPGARPVGNRQGFKGRRACGYCPYASCGEFPGHRGAHHAVKGKRACEYCPNIQSGAKKSVGK